MSNIHKTDNNYDFSKLALHNPKGLQGGTFFSKLLFDDAPALIQTPKCLTKDGIHKTEKRIYCDLKFKDSNEIFFTWIENLEEKIQNLIYEKKDVWFHNDMDMDGIEYHWQKLLRSYKRNFQLLRTFIQKPRNFDSSKLIQIYDEQENALTLEDIKPDTEVISILEISGLKFTSQSFNLEFYLRQIMVLKNKPLFNKCLISLNDRSNLEEKLEPMKMNNTLEINEKKTNTLENTSTNKQPIKENIKENINENITNKSLSMVDETINTTKINNSNNNSVSNIIVPDINDNIQNEVLDNKEMDELKKDVSNEIQEIDKTLEKNDVLSEINIELPKPENTMKLKPANEVYVEIYKEARKRAKKAKKEAIKTYLEAKRIKATYLMDDIESSEDDLEDYADLFN